MRDLPCGVFGSFGWSGEAVDELENRLKVLTYCVLVLGWLCVAMSVLCISMSVLCYAECCYVCASPGCKRLWVRKCVHLC